MDKMKTYVALILDKSGSMKSIRDTAINNFNEQLQVLKKESNSPEVEAKKVLLASDPANVSQGIETKVSVIVFNDTVNTIDFDVDVNAISEITHQEYDPDGMTALYDAIGFTIDKFRDHYDLSDPNTGVLFVIITDGEENSSKTYSGKEGRRIIKSKVDELNATGKWTFTFLGTNSALDEIKDFDMHKMAFAATDNGLKHAMDIQTASTQSYYKARKMGKTTVEDFYATVEEEK